MLGRNFSPIRPGQQSGSPSFNRALTAGMLNAPRAELERLGRLRGGSGVSILDTPGGPQVNIVTPGQLYIQLTGPAAGDGGYPWAEFVRVYQQGYVATGRTGGNDPGADGYDPAYESQTGDTTLTADGTTYLANYSVTSGNWLFDGKN